MNLHLLISLTLVVWCGAEVVEYSNLWSESATVQQFCAHDGFLNTTSGVCRCTTDYDGVNCADRTCRNFGMKANNKNVDRCFCPNGFNGRNCEPVSLVDGSKNIFKQNYNERTVSLIATYNSFMGISWQKEGDLADLVCNYTGSYRNFLIGGTTNLQDETITAQKCKESIEGVKEIANLTCVDEDGQLMPNAVNCAKLNVETILPFLQTTTPNSILIITTNVNVTSTDASLSQKIVATAIARNIQIHVFFSGTLLLTITENDVGLQYLANIATSTLGSFVMRDFTDDQSHYPIAEQLIDMWRQDIGITAVANSDGRFPLKSDTDIYVSARVGPGQDLTIFGNVYDALVQTNRWKLYKVPASDLQPFFFESGQKTGTIALIYSADRIKVYSAFIAEKHSDASYPITVAGTSYQLALRMEDKQTVMSAGDIASYLAPFSVGDIKVSGHVDRLFPSQFNILADATCNVAGASTLMIVTNDRRSAAVQLYCADLEYATTQLHLEEKIVEHTYKQSFIEDIACGAEGSSFEKFDGRSFVIHAENTINDIANMSSVDNIFVNPSSIIYQLRDYLNGNPIHYSNYRAVLSGVDPTAFTTISNNDFDKFLTQVMQATASPAKSTGETRSAKESLKATIDAADMYSDIFYIVNFDITMDDGDVWNVFDLLNQKRARLYVLFVEVFKPTDSAVYTLFNSFAVHSGGIATRLQNYDDLHTFFVQYYPLLVANDIVGKGFSENAKPGIAINDLNLKPGQYLLMLTNTDLIGSEIVTEAKVQAIGSTTVQAEILNIIGDLQLFAIDIKEAGSYQININFNTVAQQANAVLLSNTNDQDFVSVAFVDKNGAMHYNLVYNAGKMPLVIYSSTPFDTANSTVSITFSDATQPFKPIYSGSITTPSYCDDFQNYKYTTNFDWICTASNGLYHIKIDRATTSNGTITRTFPITCFGGESKCLNGGTENSQNGCDCTLSFTGDVCQTPLCQNGGTVTTGNTCNCTAAFGGDFCELSQSACQNTLAEAPDYRSDVSSLIVVVDVTTLSTTYLTEKVSLIGVPITLILYGDDQGPRVVSTSLNAQDLLPYLQKVVLPTASSSTTTSPGVDTSALLYPALRLALSSRTTDRTFIVLLASSTDIVVDSDFLIDYSVRRTELRILTTETDMNSNLLTLSLVGNGIPAIGVTGADLQTYFVRYIVPLFTNTNSQRVLNVHTTDFSNETSVTIIIDKDDSDTSDDNVVILHVFNGDCPGEIKIGATAICVYIAEKANEGFEQTLTRIGDSGLYYSVETISYLKTSYLFNNDTSGTDENLNVSPTTGTPNAISIYSAPRKYVAEADPQNFPYIVLREIVAGGFGSPSNILFTKKADTSCFFSHFAVLSVCQSKDTIGYQAQMYTRNMNKKQQFVITCHQSSYSDGLTACGGFGSPEKTGCDCNRQPELNIFFRGVKCSEPLCNTGVRDGEVCRCPPPYYGQNCENEFNVTLPTTTAGPTSTAAVVTSTSVPSTVTSAQPSTSVPSTVTSAQASSSTAAPSTLMVTAFIVDIVGPQELVYNQTIDALVAYLVNTFPNNAHQVMIVNNEMAGLPLTFDFRLVDPTSNSSIFNILNIYFKNRKPLVGKTPNLTAPLTSILNSYNSKKANFVGAKSMNIFYLTQVGLADGDDPTTVSASLDMFAKSSVIISPFGTYAPATVAESLNKFSPNSASTMDYYTSLKYMVTQTANKDDAILPPKPNYKCVFPLQTNIQMAVDKSFASDDVKNKFTEFMFRFQAGFNYVSSNEGICTTNATVLPDYWNGATAFSAFKFYEEKFTSGSFCPSSYSIITNAVDSNITAPQYTATQITKFQKAINSKTCICTRFEDPDTNKYVIWLPRAPGPNNPDFAKQLNLTATNGAQFVVPFYDMDKATDMYYMILNNNPTPNGMTADDFLLPNAATADIPTLVDDLYSRLCKFQGIDPTAIPPELKRDYLRNYFDFNYY